MFDLPPHFGTDLRSAFAGVLAEAAHPFAKFFSAFDGSAMRNAPGEALAAARSTLTCFPVMAPNAAMFRLISSGAVPPIIRNLEFALRLVLILRLR